ncbi:glycogen debranching protein [Persicobacter psychrovividus]|uniref:Alpha-L-rhamnosidase six-hairpin glycosidase domain-containing protein n=1 Tax=Persicobacter psychrovividus TaxID=387638 RepID=A0ABN6LI20_9BACT|nr:hypothetical protein PEPS_33270 [Persicobacter psychrovividus]
MKKCAIGLLFFAMMACNSKAPQDQAIYSNDTFSVYPTKVTQGKYTAKVVGTDQMTTDYLSPQNENYMRTVNVRFSINLKNDELPYGQFHQVVVRPDANGHFDAPMITFGQLYTAKDAGVKEKLEPDTKVTYQLNMKPVFDAFAKQGYYVDAQGEKIYKEDFKGVFIAGNSFPLNDDYVNLGNRGFEMKDPDGDHIYTIDLTMNFRHPDRYVKTEWKLSKDISNYPQLETELPILKSLYDMALEETVLLSEPDGTFRTGAKWDGVWTRDVSYAITLGMGMADVERAKTSLRKKVKRGRIIQDTGSGGAWPVSSDRVVWSMAAWEIYAVSGDQQWLNYAYNVIKNSVEDDRHIILDKNTNLMRGESSFLDWRVQTYPRWMDNVDIYHSLNLGTNAAHYRAYQILADMAGVLKKTDDQATFTKDAKVLKDAINKHFWLENQKYYGQYLYGRRHRIASEKSEALGEAFTVLFGIADGQRAQDVIANTPQVVYGVPCVYPQIPDMTPYHNDGIWPFVQSFWNLAAAKAGNEQAVEHGLADIYRAAALFLTNKENMVANDGDFITTLNSDRQLWSVAGNLGMVYKLLFGMQVSPEGKLMFHPFIPQSFANNMKLKNFKLRKMSFDISISGYGNQIKSFKVDGKPSEAHDIDLSGTGNHTVEIVMANNALPKQQINVVENHYHLPKPDAQIKAGKFSWAPVKGAKSYEVFIDGKSQGKTTETSVATDQHMKEYTVRAIDSKGFASFLSEPVLSNEKQLTVYKMRSYARDRKQAISKALPQMIDLTKKRNTHLKWAVKAPQAGKYFIWFDYANGSGPWNTDNKCATRTLSINGQEISPIVMAQRGTDEWASVGQTNIIEVQLKKGTNHLSLDFTPHNENMNVEVNRALLGNMYLQQKK